MTNFVYLIFSKPIMTSKIVQLFSCWPFWKFETEIKTEICTHTCAVLYSTHCYAKQHRLLFVFVLLFAAERNRESHVLHSANV